MTQLTLRLDWSEQDLYGHINNVSYFKYQQASRVNFWEAVGITAQDGKSGLGPMLAAVNMRFIKPLHYPGMVRIETSVVFIKNTSFGLMHQMYNERGELCAQGEDVVVAFDYRAGEKREIASDLRAMLESHVSTSDSATPTP
jgi:acyl-CoA thioester hydrolase